MEAPCTPPAARRFSRWLPTLVILVMASVFGVSWALESRPLDPGARLALALIPVVLWGVTLIVVMAGIRQLDELQKRIQLEALAIAFPTAAMLGLLVEYLQKAGFVQDWNVGDVWPWMILSYVPAYFYARWRYR